jgi:purine nucleoside phosphorylase
MNARQAGEKLKDVLAMITGSGLNDKALIKLTVDAYDEPEWDDKTLKQKSIKEFAESFHVSCIKNIT